MASGLPKRADDHIPYCEGQGIPYLTGSNKAGQSLQVASYVAGAGTDAIVFVDEGLTDMANATFEAIAINQTSAARPVVTSARATTGFSIAGQNASDVMTLFIIGQLAGQTA